MPFSPRNMDRRVSMVLYAAFGSVAFWVGIVLINYSLDFKFYNDYLLKWEVALRAYNQGSAPWPYFSGGNHVEYMEKVTQLMSSKALSPPASNTERLYVYSLDRIGDPEEDVFLLCFTQKIILYGISSKTFDHLDGQIDGRDGTKKGRFTGILSKDGYTYVGLWLI